jgi:CubicO group peptidase (beta-lactamase class C family)
MIKIHQGEADCDPAAARYDGDALKALDAHFERLIEAKRIQCASYMLSRGGKVFARKALGDLRWTEDSPGFRTDSIRHIASISKIFTATAVMQQVERGRLYLYQSIASIIPEFDTKQHKAITIADLLTHTSGLKPDSGAMAEPYPVGWKKFEDSPEGLSEMLKDFLSGPVLRPRGREWMYCSAGFSVLAEVVKRVTGKGFIDYVRTEILETLGMTETGFEVDEADMARVCLTGENEEWLYERRYGKYMEVFAAGNGLISTLGDLHRFGLALLGKGKLDGARILGGSTLELMSRNQLEGVVSECWGSPRVEDYHYGLGFVLYEGGNFSPGCFGHEGAGRSLLIVDPAEEFVAAWYVPSRIGWVAESIRNTPAVMWSGLL